MAYKMLETVSIASEHSLIFVSYSKLKLRLKLILISSKLSIEEMKGSKSTEALMLSSTNLYKISKAKLLTFLTSSFNPLNTKTSEICYSFSAIVRVN